MRRFYTQEEDSYIMAHMPDAHPADVAETLGRTEAAVEQRFQRLKRKKEGK